MVRTERMGAGGIDLTCRLRPEHYVPADAPIVRELLKCYEEYTGRKGEPLAIGGGTYVHNLKNGVAFGCTFPGRNPKMHEPDENMPVSDLKLSAAIFAAVIERFCA